MKDWILGELKLYDDFLVHLYMECYLSRDKNGVAWRPFSVSFVISHLLTLCIISNSGLILCLFFASDQRSSTATLMTFRLQS